MVGGSRKLVNLVPRSITGTPGADPRDEILQRYNLHLPVIKA